MRTITPFEEPPSHDAAPHSLTRGETIPQVGSHASVDDSGPRRAINFDTQAGLLASGSSD